MRPSTLPAAALACLTIASSGPAAAAAHDPDYRLVQTSTMPVAHAPVAGNDRDSAPDRLGHAAFLIGCGVIGVYLLRKANHGRGLPDNTRTSKHRPGEQATPAGDRPQGRPAQESCEGRLRAS